MTSRILFGLCTAASFFAASLGLPASAAAEPTVWYTHWYKGPSCSGDICTSTSDSDIARFWVSGDGFTVGGQVYVGIFDLDGTPIESATVTATSHDGFDAGSFGKKFNKMDCGIHDEDPPENAFIQAHDLATDVWSNWIFVDAKCVTL